MKSRLTPILMIAGGVLLGWFAASADWFDNAEAKVDDANSSAVTVPGQNEENKDACCRGDVKAQLLAANQKRAARQAVAKHNETVLVNAQKSGKQPNIVFIMGDDIGMWNIGAYHRGLMAGRTPNIDKLAREGAIFTDYYAEASCTAGRANFITSELPIRTGLTTVGQAGADIDQPQGWFGPKVKLDWPGVINLRLDPFEKMTIGQSLFAKDWWAFEFWRYVFVQQEVGKLARTAIAFPPMQPGASFNLEAVKEKIKKAMSSRTGQ